MKHLIAVLMLFPALAFATGFGNDKTYNTATAMQGQMQGQAQLTSVDVSNRISADTRASALSYATGSQANNVLTVNQAPIPDKLEIKGVPNVYSGNVYPTTSCAHSSTVGGSGVGFGVALGTSWTDEECSLRETARSFQLLGKTDDAVHVLCTSKYAAAAPSCAKLVTTQGEAK